MTEDELIEAIRAIPGLLPPASAEAIEEVEQAIGHSLPPLLRRLYLEAANGGFGPRDGVLASGFHGDGLARLHEKSAFELGGLGLSRVLSTPVQKALSE